MSQKITIPEMVNRDRIWGARMIHTAALITKRLGLVVSVFAFTIVAVADNSTIPWIDRVFTKAKAVHVAKEMTGFTTTLQLHESFLAHLMEGNNKEIRYRNRLGGQIPKLDWPETHAADNWQFLDTIDLLSSYEQYRDLATTEFNAKLAAARRIRRDLLSTGSSLDVERMREFDWTSFRHTIAQDRGMGRITLDPALGMLISDEYARNYPQALADSFWFYRGEAALTGGYYDDAISAYDRVVSNEGSVFRRYAFIRLSFLFSEIGDVEKINNNWKLWVAAGKPGASEGRIQFFTGRTRYDAGDYAGAVEALENIPSSSIYTQQSNLILGMCYAMLGQYDAGLRTLKPLLADKLFHKVKVTPEMSRFARIKYAQILNLARKYDEAFKTLSPLSSHDLYGDQVLITRAWIYRSIPKFGVEITSTLDTLINRSTWSPYVPIATAWKAELTELQKGIAAALPAYEKILTMSDENRQLADYAQERYQLYDLDNKLSLIEGDILRKNDIALFAKFLDQRRQIRLLIQRNKYGATLIAIPQLDSLYTEEVAVGRMIKSLDSTRKLVDSDKQAKQMKTFIRLQEKADELASKLDELMARASQITPALQREQDVAAFNKQVSDLAVRSRQQLTQSVSTQSTDITDRASLAGIHMHLERFNTTVLVSKLDQINTDIDRAAGFAMAHYALGGFDFDALNRKQERSGELDSYIKKLETALKEKELAEEERSAAVDMGEPAKNDTLTPPSPAPVINPEKK